MSVTNQTCQDALVTAVGIHEARMAEALQKRARVSYVSTGTSAAEKPLDGGVGVGGGGGGGGAEGTSAGNVSIANAIAGKGGQEEAGGVGSGQAEGGGKNDTVGAKRDRGGSGGTSGDSVV